MPRGILSPLRLPIPPPALDSSTNKLLEIVQQLWLIVKETGPILQRFTIPGFGLTTGMPSKPRSSA